MKGWQKTVEGEGCPVQCFPGFIISFITTSLIFAKSESSIFYCRCVKQFNSWSFTYTSLFWKKILYITMMNRKLGISHHKWEVMVQIHFWVNWILVRCSNLLKTSLEACCRFIKQGNSWVWKGVKDLLALETFSLMWSWRIRWPFSLLNALSTCYLNYLAQELKHLHTPSLNSFLTLGKLTLPNFPKEISWWCALNWFPKYETFFNYYVLNEEQVHFF